MARKPNFIIIPGAKRDIAYRQYLIKHIRDGQFAISKDGHHIAYAKSIEAAKADIDLIAD